MRLNTANRKNRDFHGPEGTLPVIFFKNILRAYYFDYEEQVTNKKIGIQRNLFGAKFTGSQTCNIIVGSRISWILG